MTPYEEAQVTSRLRHASMTHQGTQVSYLATHRRLKNQSVAEVEAFWEGPGLRLEALLRASATELIAAFNVFSAAGLVASADDRHLVTEAKRSVAQDTA